MLSAIPPSLSGFSGLGSSSFSWSKKGNLPERCLSAHITNTSAPMEMHAHVLIWGFKAAYLKQRSSYVQWDKATRMQIISSCPLGSELASVSPATLTMSCHSLRCDASFYIATPFELLAYAHGCLVATSVL